MLVVLCLLDSVRRSIAAIGESATERARWANQRNLIYQTVELDSAAAGGGDDAGRGDACWA